MIAQNIYYALGLKTAVEPDCSVDIVSNDTKFQNDNYWFAW